ASSWPPTPAPTRPPRSTRTRCASRPPAPPATPPPPSPSPSRTPGSSSPRSRATVRSSHGARPPATPSGPTRATTTISMVTSPPPSRTSPSPSSASTAAKLSSPPARPARRSHGRSLWRRRRRHRPPGRRPTSPSPAWSASPRPAPAKASTAAWPPAPTASTRSSATAVPCGWRWRRSPTRSPPAASPSSTGAASRAARAAASSTSSSRRATRPLRRGPSSSPTASPTGPTPLSPGRPPRSPTGPTCTSPPRRAWTDAVAHLGVVGTAVQSSSEDEVTLALDQAVPADATILLAIAWDSPSPGGVPAITGVADTGGNSWSTTPDVSAHADATVAVAILRTRVTTELDQGDTITVTIDDARGRWCMQADAFDDVVASPLDETTSNDGSSSALSTGTTGTTSTPHQLLYAVFGFGGGRDAAVPDGWPGAAKLETSAGSGNRALQVTHRYVAAPGAYEATLPLSTSSTYAAAMGTYEIVPPDPEARLSQLRIQAPNP